MSIKLIIKSLEGIDWKKNQHYIPEEEISFQDFIDSKEVEVGDTVTIENKAECLLPLDDNEYCVTFSKECEGGGSFFTEEPFTKDECKLLFGKDFNY